VVEGRSREAEEAAQEKLKATEEGNQKKLKATLDMLEAAQGMRWILFTELADAAKPIQPCSRG
jgi:hypothetical protein